MVWWKSLFNSNRYLFYDDNLLHHGIDLFILLGLAGLDALHHTALHLVESHHDNGLVVLAGIYFYDGNLLHHEIGWMVLAGIYFYDVNIFYDGYDVIYLICFIIKIYWWYHIMNQRFENPAIQIYVLLKHYSILRSYFTSQPGYSNPKLNLIHDCFEKLVPYGLDKFWIRLNEGECDSHVATV